MPGIWRSIYYILGIEYNSINDLPNEKDVKIKQVCMRQISLSKVKLNHVEEKERTPPDLEKIIVNPEFKIEYNNQTDIKRDVSPTPNNSPWFKSR
jgi:hypothetical protein